MNATDHACSSDPNYGEFGAAQAGPDELCAYLEGQAATLAGVPGEQVAVALGDVSPVDAAALTGDFADYLAGSLSAAISTGIWGWFDDDLVFIRPWGFELDGIRVPVVIWQGGQDRMVPAHGECWRCPARRGPASCRRRPPSIALAMFGEIVDELLASAPRPGG